MITKIKQQQNGLQVTLEDGRQLSVPEGYSGWLTEMIESYTGEIEPEFTEEELLKQKQDEFRLERNSLLNKTDIAINIAEDLGQDSKELRTYRQALRDATIKWVMPVEIV